MTKNFSGIDCAMLHHLLLSMRMFTGLMAGMTVAAGAGLNEAELDAPPVRYGTAHWDARGHGNHRAVVTVGHAAPAVRARIPWRRRDVRPEAKAVLVFNAAGERITNVRVVRNETLSGEIIFEAEVPGEYFLYYLPYNPGIGNFDDPGTYFPAEETADAGWLRSIADRADLPEAELLELQARGEFHRFDPMEVMPTGNEIARMAERAGNPPYLLFCEDRLNPVRMLHDIPLKWVLSGPTASFHGTASPDEWYPWQIALWANGTGLEDIRVVISDFTNPNGEVIPAGDFTCLNLEGIDARGLPFTRNITVGLGDVQPLWFLGTIPPDARGVYRGTVTVKPGNAPPQTAEISLTVQGEPLSDHGVGELWRLSRLKWLNSTLGIDAEVIPPFKAIEFAGRTAELLLSRITFGSGGLPERISVDGKDILSAPITLNIAGPDGAPIHFPEIATEVLELRPGMLRQVALAASPELDYELESALEMDGALTCTLVLRAKQPLSLNDVQLLVPMAREAATYQMGFGERGGYRRGDVDWKWDISRLTNQIWVGEVWGGLQLKLIAAADSWNNLNLESIGLPEGWYNAGKGGGRVVARPDAVEIQAYSGSREMAAGQVVKFSFRFLITPSKPLEASGGHWSYRYAGPRANIMHLHHSVPGNSYISYPFLEVDRLRSMIRDARDNTVQEQAGTLVCVPESGFDFERGSVEAEVKVGFDPAETVPGNAAGNKPLFGIRFRNGDVLYTYWNVDVRGLRSYATRGVPGDDNYHCLIDSPTPGWAPDQVHRIGLSWDRGVASVWIDGKLAGQGRYPLDWSGEGAGAEFFFPGTEFGISGVRLRNLPLDAVSADAPLAADAATIFFDLPGGASSAARSDGMITRKDGFAFNGSDARPMPVGTNLYYTVRDLSNFTWELWALRSFGDEIFETGSAFVYSVEKTEIAQAGGGDPWLREHLLEGYVPSWRQPLWNGEVDAAIATTGLSRWHNYYIEGLQWLMRNVGFDGLYLDGIGYDRGIMKRVGKVMQRNNPEYRINFHSGNNYDFLDQRCSSMNLYMEHLPYISDLWFGEMYDYDFPPDYWLIELSGIPFGLYNDMLNYENGGNPYRGMVYGMTGRGHPGAAAMYDLWDDFGIAESRLIGYWDVDVPVRTNHSAIPASVFVRSDGKALVSLAHWSEAAERERRSGQMAETPCGVVTLDGVIDTDEWRSAAELSNFLHFSDARKVPFAQQTQAWVTFDATHLYVAVRSYGAGPDPKRSILARDGQVWLDDAVEIFIQPDIDSRNYIQAIINAAGTVYDARNQSGQNADFDWRTACRITDNSWECEASIPLAELGLTAEMLRQGHEIGFNICRDHQTPEKLESVWSPVIGFFHDVAHFGRLRAAASGAPSREMLKPDLPSAGEVEFRLLVDWDKLGLDPDRTRISQPAIRHFQDGRDRISIDNPLHIQNNRGMILLLEGI